MGLFRRGKRAERKETEKILDSWVAERRGVEVYVEPKTPVSPVSMLLVAHDGEFTRRTVAGPEQAKDFARDHQLPIYDAMIVGYPQRMRDWSRKQKILERRRAPGSKLEPREVRDDDATPTPEAAPAGDGGE